MTVCEGKYGVLAEGTGRSTELNIAIDVPAPEPSAPPQRLL
ncbi:hypothetical protein [Streptomyces sp. CBMA152]|nr:hypothetical protein [Streptomyces sp. CBMA152]